MDLKLWITRPEDLKSLQEAETDEDRYKYVHFITDDLDMRSHGWIFAGSANIEMNILPMEKLIPEAVKVMDEKIESIRAESQLKIQYVMDLKNNLLALPNL